MSRRCYLLLAAAALAFAIDTKTAGDLYRKKDWQGLANLTSAAIRKDSKDGWAWYYSGLANDGMGHKDAAVTAYENARHQLPATMLISVVQLLAQDYAALKQQASLAALYHEMEKSHPEIALSLRSQFRDAIGAPAPATAPAPEVSPHTLAALSANIRRTWRADAIAVMVNVKHRANGYEVTTDFYSPSQKSGLMAVQSGANTTNLPAANPNWGTAAIPETFLPLDAAVARASAEGEPGTLDHAFLYRAGNDQGVPVNVVWDLAIDNGGVRGMEIAAYILPKDRFDALLRTAAQGDKGAQLTVARVYASGLTGTPDPGQAFQWCSRAASAGSAEAENVLGQMYQFGRGTRVDIGLALKWYRASANAGFAAGEYNLGLMYEKGIGVARNYIAARDWIVKAARQGLAEAQGELAYVTARANGQARQAKAQADTSHQPVVCRVFQHWNPKYQLCQW